jgi:hypothetical protein
MERTGHADFDGVTLDGLFSPLKLQKFGARRRTGATRRQSSSKDIRHLDQLGVRTDRTGLARRPANILRRPQKFRMRVTDIFVAQSPLSELGEQRVTNETELDDGPIRSAGAKALIH